ncbi:MAG: DUF4160 domain-containing protein [Flavobacteriales bacterium]
MPKLYEYFGLVFLFWTHEHEPMHLHVQYGSSESIVELIVQGGKLTTLNWRSKRGKRALGAQERAEAERFVRNKFADIERKWFAYFVERKHITPERITRRIK